MKPSCMRCGGSTKKNKMAAGGTTTKRIIKKSTGGMYGIPQENLGTSGQYGFAKKGGVIKKYAKGGTKPPCPPGYHMEGSDCVKDQKAFDSTGAKLGFFGALTGALGLGAKIAVDSQRERNKNKIPRLKERETNLVSRGNKAADEGRDKKANRLLGRAAKVENRIITLEEKKAKSSYKKGGTTKNTKLAAVAAPKNKITRADVLTRILKKKKN
jgi:hypothetical protein